MDYTIEIGLCASQDDSKEYVQIECLGDDGLNYCCQQPDSSNLVGDSGKRSCCSYDDYADQQWSTLAAIRGYSFLLGILSTYTLLALAYFYWMSKNVKETDLHDQHQDVIKQLIKHEIIHKSKLNQPSAIDSLRSLSNSLSWTKNKQTATKQPAMSSIGHKDIPSRTSSRKGAKHLRFASHEKGHRENIMLKALSRGKKHHDPDPHMVDFSLVS